MRYKVSNLGRGGVAMFEVAAATVLLCIGQAIATPQFFELGPTPSGTGSFATAMSADGGVVIGHAEVRNSRGVAVWRPWRWSVTQGYELLESVPESQWLQPLPQFPMPQDLLHFTSHVSRDGSTIAGAIIDNSAFFAGGFVWDRAAGTRVLDTPMSTSGEGFVAVRDMNDDGSVIVAQRGESELIRWTRQTGVQTIASPFGTRLPSVLQIDQAGGIIAAAQRGASGPATRWTPGGGEESLGAAFFPGVMSADGSVIAGTTNLPNTLGVPSNVMVWHASGGLTTISPLGGHTHIGTNLMDASGRVLFGTSFSISEFGPIADMVTFIWTPESGATDLRVMLTAQGVQLPSGARLGTIAGISDDLTTL
ncbi:MAG: hypothetical protein K2X32_15615, partial [Phycisphaerales bacterium]|nr:hypothetical protein [Phycisphaerales bacterium]